MVTYYLTECWVMIFHYNVTLNTVNYLEVFLSRYTLPAYNIHGKFQCNYYSIPLFDIGNYLQEFQNPSSMDHMLRIEWGLFIKTPN